MFSGRENVLYLIKNNKVDFDKNIALEYLGNNDNLYNKLIKEYVNNHKTLDKEMIFYLEKNNYQKLYHKIHDISMMHRLRRYDVMLRIMMLLVSLAMMRCLPQNIRRSRHH